MATELLAGLGIFKSMLDMAKGLKDMNDAAVRNGAVIELQEKILAAREQQTALAEQIRELEAQVAKFETWDAEKQRYQLTDFGGGTFAYFLKPDMRGSEPAHRICAACYEKGQKSILQFDGQNSYGQDRYECPACKTTFNFGIRQESVALRNRPQGGGSWMGS